MIGNLIIERRRGFTLPNGEHIEDDAPEIGGRRQSDYYIYQWCRDKHRHIDRRLDSIDGRDGSIGMLHKKVNTVRDDLVGKIDAEYEKLDKKYNRIMWFLLSILFSILGSGAYVGYYIGVNI